MLVNQSVYYVICLQALAFAGAGSVAQASQINKPAGALPVAQSAPAPVPLGLSSKSKVVPLKRRMDIANSGKATIDIPLKKKTTLPVVEPATQLKVARSQVATSSADGQPKRTVEAEDGVWDSANKRYDGQEQKGASAKKIRVEDIIEPTVEYRYSSARRKNPFIPEIVLTGQIARQRELSPNDVEIPIVSPLQSFAISQLSVIGVWETDNHVWKALIGTPATQGIEAKLGDPVGNSGGRIMSISPESVIAREFSVRFDGTREYRDVPLNMGSELPTERDPEEKVGGRLILRPGATQPELVPPQAMKKSDGDYLISNSAMAVPTATPGTLKTIERVMGQPDDGSVQNGPLTGSETINQVEKNVNNPDLGAQPQQETPVSGGAR